MAKRINKQTAAYIDEHKHPTLEGASALDCGDEPKSYLIADVHGMPKLVRRTMTRLFGHPSTMDRGETAYWVIPADMARA